MISERSDDYVLILKAQAWHMLLPYTVWHYCLTSSGIAWQIGNMTIDDVSSSV